MEQALHQDLCHVSNLRQCPRGRADKGGSGSGMTQRSSAAARLDAFAPRGSGNHHCSSCATVHTWRLLWHGCLPAPTRTHRRVSPGLAPSLRQQGSDKATSGQRSVGQRSVEQECAGAASVPQVPRHALPALHPARECTAAGMHGRAAMLRRSCGEQHCPAGSAAPDTPAPSSTARPPSGWVSRGQ